jgi:hypothetical protein
MKKVKEIDDEDEWSIKGFKSFSIAAVEYFPEYTSTDAQLLADLKPTHYTHKTARLSPKQQCILFTTWGPPEIKLHGHDETPENQK